MIVNQEEKKSSEKSKASLGSLLNLFLSDYFTLDMCLYYINKRFETGIQDYLVNKLYTYNDHEVSFYIPQLCYLLIKRQSPSIEKFLLDKCKGTLTIFLKIYWCLEAFSKSSAKLTKAQEEYVASLLLRAEREMVNGCMKLIEDRADPNEKNILENRNIVEKGNIEMVAKAMFVKSARSEYLRTTQKLMNILVGLSLKLKQYDEDKRKAVMRGYIKKINAWLRFHRRNALQAKETAKLYEGVQIPFLDPLPEVSSFMIVEINEEEIHCFNTRKRVPVKVVFETIDPRDLATNNERPITTSVTVKRRFGSNVKFRAGSTKSEQDEVSPMTDDIDELVSELMMDEKTIKMIKQEAEDTKYQGLKQFSKIVQQEEKKMKKNMKDSSNKAIEVKLRPSFDQSGKQDMILVSQDSNQVDIINNYKPFNPRISVKAPSLIHAAMSGDDGAVGEEENSKQSREMKHAENLKKFKESFPGFSLMKRSRSLEKPGLGHRKHRREFSSRQFTLEEYVKYLEAYRFTNMPDTHNDKVNQILSVIHKKLDERELLEFPWLSEDTDLVKVKSIFGRDWELEKKSIANDSPFGHFPSYRIRPYIIKGGDDLRQELIAMQLMYKFHKIWKDAGLSLKLRPYDIIVISEDSGLIEFIPNTVSIDYLKKKWKNYSGLKDFYTATFKDDFEEAQKNFIDSLAGYCLLTYLLNVKDRHNGNILIDSEGHIIHIDFGFIISSSPGNTNFESAPFKLTVEYVELCGGYNSDMFYFFKMQLLKGLIELRKHVDSIVYLLNIMKTDTQLPCFDHFDEKAFRDRFMEFSTDKDILVQIDKLIEWSYNNWRTNQYDLYQKLTNGILP